MTEEPKVVTLARKPFVAPAPVDPDAVVVDECSLKLLTGLIERVKAGELRGICVAGLSDNLPIRFTTMNGLNMADLAMLNVGIDSLKDHVLNAIHEWATYVDPATGEDVDLEDLEDEEDPA